MDFIISQAIASVLAVNVDKHGIYDKIALAKLDSCGCNSMAEFQLPKLATWVRFPSPAPGPK